MTKQTWLCCTKSFHHSFLFSLTAFWQKQRNESMGRHLHLGSYENPRHMVLGLLTQGLHWKSYRDTDKTLQSWYPYSYQESRNSATAQSCPCFRVVFPANWFLWAWLGSMTHLINHFKVSKILEIVKGQSIIRITRGAEIQKADLDLRLSFLCQSWGLNIQFSLVCR